MGKKVKTIDDLVDDRVPETEDKHVGIEIEFFSIYEEDKLADMLLKSPLSDYVTLKEDSSIDPYTDSRCECCCRDCHEGEACGGEFPEEYRYGHELCVLAKQSELSQVMRMVGAFLKKAKAEVNGSCGLHVHLDMRTRDKRIAFKNLVHIQEVLYRMCAPSRRGNTYCQPVHTTNLDETKGHSRYRSINTAALEEHDTIEIRLHHGTVDAKDILLWARMLCHAVDAKALERNIKTAKSAAKQLGVNKVIAKYMERKERSWRSA